MHRKIHAIGIEQTLTLLSNNAFPEPASAEQLKLVDEEQLLILAIKRRSDLKIKDTQIEIERIKLKKLENKKLPTLDFFVSGGSSAASSNFSDHVRKLYTDSTEKDGGLCGRHNSYISAWQSCCHWCIQFRSCDFGNAKTFENFKMIRNLQRYCFSNA